MKGKRLEKRQQIVKLPVGRHDNRDLRFPTGHHKSGLERRKIVDGLLKLWSVACFSRGEVKAEPAKKRVRSKLRSFASDGIAFRGRGNAGYVPGDASRQIMRESISPLSSKDGSRSRYKALEKSGPGSYPRLAPCSM